MIAGKADKEELQALRRLLGDKVNLADYQVICLLMYMTYINRAINPEEDHSYTTSLYSMYVSTYVLVFAFTMCCVPCHTTSCRLASYSMLRVLLPWVLH